MKRNSTSNHDAAVRRDLAALSNMAQLSDGDAQHPPVKVSRVENPSREGYQILRTPNPNRPPVRKAVPAAPSAPVVSSAHVVLAAPVASDIAELRDQYVLKKDPIQLELGKVRIPGPRPDLQMTLDEYLELPKEKFEKRFDTDIKKLIIALIEESPSMWPGEYVKIMDAQWEKFAVDFYLRTGVLMAVGHFREIWTRMKKEMAKKVKAVITADRSNQIPEKNLREWKFYLQMKFCGPMIEEVQRKKVAQLARNQKIHINKDTFDGNHIKEEVGTGKFPEKLVKTENEWMGDFEPDRSPLQSSSGGTSSFLVEQLNLQRDEDLIEFIPPPTQPDYEAEAKFVTERLRQLAKVSVEAIQAMDSLLENTSAEVIRLIRSQRDESKSK
ncbi:hypothetical protein CAEBREN_04218 [Caenorhabditis brenneri]|uniref:Uncharacterized protein n=1 Tax=Caenorhabditis brenneri TaxID=135651 RepID=G0P687_CAEBE|nr:hypothetical protein CAEBREN_04218 [Caenorhabditis brenneri]